MARRIAYFVDTDFFGGAERMIVDLCREALRRGDEPILLHFGHEELASQVNELGVTQRILPCEDAYRSIKTVWRFSRCLDRLLGEESIEVLHSHLFGPVFAGALATVGPGTRHVGTLHDSYTLTDRPTLTHGLTLAALLGTRLVAVSPSVREAARFARRVPRTGVRVIENGVPLPGPPNADETAALRSEFCVEPKEMLVCAVARLVPIKGLDVLVKAWARHPFADRGRLVLVGEGPEQAALEALACSLGVEASVTFAGFRRDVPAILNAANAFVLPSHSEGLSCSLLEAMAHGLPCVATRVGGNPRLVVEGETGFLVEPGDPETLSDRLWDLFNSDAEENALGRAGRDRIERDFSASATYDAYWDLYGPSM